MTKNLHLYYFRFFFFFFLGLIGLAYPLFNAFLPLYLKNEDTGNSGVSTVYRNYVIISVLGIPGSIVACLVVDWTRKPKKNSEKEKEEGTDDNGDPEGQKNGVPETEKKKSTLRVPTTSTLGVFSGLKVLGGRKLTMIVSTLLSGIFLFLFTTSRGAADVLGYSCATSFTQCVSLPLFVP